MSDLLKKCEEFFGTRDFYEVLKINRSSSTNEIKKAYYKLSLLVHPDRVEDTEKELATEKFKLLGKIHSILQDSDKRKIYDECGTFDVESYSVTNWLNYWGSMFKKISTEDIENHKKEYIGSDTEKIDIKNAYVGTKGDMNRILEMVPFSNCENEPRIINIVKGMVETGEVEEFSGFFNEPERKKNHRKRKEVLEKRKSEKLNIRDNDLAEEIHNRQAKQLEAKYGGKTVKRKSTKNSGEEPRATRSNKK